MANPRALKSIKERKVFLNLDKIGADNHIVSVELKEDIRNGSVVKLGNYNGQDYYVADKVADLVADRLVFVAASLLPYDERINDEDIVLAKGERVRAYFLKAGDMITLTNDQLDGDCVVGQFAIPQVGKYELKASTTKSDAKLNFVVVAKEKLRGLDATVLEVI